MYFSFLFLSIYESVSCTFCYYCKYLQLRNKIVYKLKIEKLLKDRSQINLSHDAFRAGIHSLRPNHEMQSHIKTVKAEKSYRAPHSNLQLSAIIVFGNGGKPFSKEKFLYNGRQLI